MLVDRAVFDHDHDKPSSTATCAPTPSTGPAAVVVGDMTLQHLFIIISVVTAAVTLASAVTLILMHLRRYTVPAEQRQIVRIVFTPAFFAIISCLSVVSYNVGRYLQPIQNLYEAYALGSMFFLLVQFAAPEDKMRERHFYHLGRRLEHGQQVPGGVLWRFNMAWILVFQYTVVKPILVIAQDSSLAAGTYCATSHSPHFAHIWITIFDSISSAMAVVAVFRFYGRCKKEMGARKPLTKLICFKLVVFLTWIQSIIFGFLPSHLSYSAKTSYDDLNFGVPNLIIGCEMVLISIAMHFAYRSSEYKTLPHSGPRMGMFRGAAHAINPSDLIRGIIRMFKLLIPGAHADRSPARADYNEAAWPQRPMQAQPEPNYQPSYQAPYPPNYPSHQYQQDVQLQPPQQPRTQANCYTAQR